MNSSDGMLIVNVSAIQAVAIAAVTYYFGAWLRKKVPFLEKYSVPSPVVGGMLVALVLSCLEYFHFMKVNFDTSLQTLLMLAFFTTIGLSASLKIVTEGGKLLVSFLFVITILCVLQNFLGMGLAEMMGLDFHYGLLAGSVSMMGGLGTSAAFGPYFEQTYGVQGGTAVAITAATFGMVVALLIGAPFAEWLIRKYKVITPKEVDTPEPELHIPEDLETTVVEGRNDRCHLYGSRCRFISVHGAVHHASGIYWIHDRGSNRQKRRRFLRQIHGRRQGNERYRRNQLGAVRDDGH